MNILKKDDLQFVIDCLPTAELMAQLAEEAAELAKAALKMRRCYDKTNPSRTPKEQAFKNLQEEIADVLLCLHALGLDTDQCCGIYDEISNRKVKRWAESLEANG